MTKEEKQKQLADEFLERYFSQPQSYFDEMRERVKRTEAEYKRLEEAQSPSWEQMHQPFNI